MRSNIIGVYRLIARLGRASTTDAFLAMRRGVSGSPELVVVKRFREDVSAADGGKLCDAVLEEARLATRLAHTHVVRTIEIGLDEGLPYRVIEYLEGQPLDRILSALPPGGLALEFALQVVSDVLLALAYAHDTTEVDGSAFGVVHREVSPHNIFVTYQGQVKLADFGDPKHVLRRDNPDAAVSASSFAYLAPEQALGMNVDRRADVFAVGSVLWELLAGRPLVAADTAEAAREKLLYEPVPKLASVRPALAPELAAICDRALEHDPEQRYPDAATMRADLVKVRSAAGAMRADLGDFLQKLFATERHARAQRIEQLVGAIVPPRPTGLDLPAPSDRDSLEPPRRLTLSRSAPPVSDRPPARRKDRLTKALPVAAVLAFISAIAFIYARWSGSSGQQAAALAHEEQPAAAPADIVLRMCGSNTVGGELAPALVEAFLSSKGTSAPTRRINPVADLTTVVGMLGGVRIGVEIRARGSATAFSGLADDSCDVGMASRAINDAEASALLEKGRDLRSPGAEHVLAMDGIAIIVHPNNSVHALDRTALHGIYTGKIQDWAALGGAQGPISLFARDDKSGTFDTFRSLVLGKDQLAESAKRFWDSAALSDAVAGEPSAIGFVGLPYVRSARALAVGEAGAAPMLPTRFTVSTESYMLSRRLYLYTLPKPRTTWSTDFVSYALSRHAQEVVNRSQFIDLGLSAQEVKCSALCSPRYAAAVAKAERVSMDFRFRTGSSEPDSRAGRDIERLVSLLGDRPNAKVLLLGFSDSVGNSAANIKLSLDRAKTIERELAPRGVYAALVTGFGAEMPLASNESDSGRQRNRRVEVWIER